MRQINQADANYQDVETTRNVLPYSFLKNSFILYYFYSHNGEGKFERTIENNQ